MKTYFENNYTRDEVACERRLALALLLCAIILLIVFGCGIKFLWDIATAPKETIIAETITVPERSCRLHRI